MRFCLLNVSSFLGKVKRLLFLENNINFCWYFIGRQLFDKIINTINCLIWKKKTNKKLLLFRWLLAGTRQHLNVTATFSKGRQYIQQSAKYRHRLVHHVLNPDYYLGIAQHEQHYYINGLLYSLSWEIFTYQSILLFLTIIDGKVSD